MNKATARLFLIALVFLTFTACGNQPVSAPSGSVITVNPSSFSYTALVSAGSDTSTQGTASTTFYITVVDSSGVPLNNTKLNIWLATATNYMQFYDGDTAQGTSFSATTDSFGTYTLTLAFEAGGGINYTNSIDISSGTAYQTIAISVH